jgi:prevent-host-death family protein
MAQFSASEARANFNHVLELAKTEAVEIHKHGKPAVVIFDAMSYEKLLDYVEDLEDTITILEHKLNPGDESEWVPLEDLLADSNLGDESVSKPLSS